MKMFLHLTVLLWTCTVLTLNAASIAQWNFESNPPDGSPSTGTNTPSGGIGTAFLIGGTTATWATGSTNDPASSADDSGWNTKSYPPSDTGNKTAGVQFNVSTLAYSNIVIRWDLKVSATASRYCRLQYSTDGSTFIDYPTPNAAQVVSATSSYYEAQTNSLAAFAGVNNNANFAFRIVSEFENTAIGSGINGYVTTEGNDYSTAGTIRFDFVVISGTPIPGANTPPSISTVSNQTVRVNQSTAALPFTVGDAEDLAASLAVTNASSNPGVISVGNIHLAGSGASRTVMASAGAQTGSSIITLYVTDTGGRSNSTTFSVTVLPVNTAPVISSISPTNTLANQATPALAFTVNDLEMPAGNLTVSGSSGNQALVPNGNIIFGGSGSDRTATITPINGLSGVALITVTVSDGTNSASSIFPLMVLPSADVLFYDTFTYANGSLLTNSAFLWANRSGTSGECQTMNGTVQITDSQSEDVSASLIGGPYTRSNSTVLYASFKMKALNLAKDTPAYFAHFSSGNANRARVFMGLNNAAPGAFRLSVANGSGSTTLLPGELLTNVTYLIVTRYDVDNASTTLWLNPATESDPNVSAIDSVTAVTISSYGFRQDSTLGTTLLVDDLRVGRTFSAVVPGAGGTSPIPLYVERRPGQVVLSWTDPAFVLQSASAASGIFTNVIGAASPFTNGTAGATKFFRLKAN